MRAVGRVLGGITVGALVATVVVMAPYASVRGAAKRSVEFTITAGENKSNKTMTFNELTRGALTITVPAGWEVVVHFENAGALKHSLAVLPAGGHQRPAAAAPAFSGATTSEFAAGLPKGSKETITFEASKAGTYEFVCGVQGHAPAGQWANLIVSATADAPSVAPPDAVTFTVK
jgi:sulfocyanin